MHSAQSEGRTRKTLRSGDFESDASAFGGNDLARTQSEAPSAQVRENPSASADVATDLATADLWSRIRERVAFSPTGCWIWQGAKNSKGYGSLRIGGRAGRSVSVHRLVVELTYGPLVASAMACHTCNVRECVNPDHLYIGDKFTNARDARRAGSYKRRASKAWETRRARRMADAIDWLPGSVGVR